MHFLFAESYKQVHISILSHHGLYYFFSNMFLTAVLDLDQKQMVYDFGKMIRCHVSV